MTGPRRENGSGRPASVVRAAVVAAGLIAGGSGCEPGALDVGGRAPDPLAKGLVAHWSFDEGGGTTIIDRSGQKHDGALSGGAWIAGHFGGALRFALGDSVTVPAFPNATPSWSLSLWVRPAAGDFGDGYLSVVTTELLAKGGWQVNARFNASSPIYEFAFWVGPGESDHAFDDCSCVVSDAWTHLAAVVDGPASALSFYANGTLDKRQDIPRAILPGSATLFMGRWEHDTNRPFAGDLDEIAIYDRALGSADIARLAAAPVPAAPSGGQ